MNQEELQAVCTSWQCRLRLQDWDVEVKLVAHYEAGESRFAEVFHFLPKKHAILKVVQEDHIDPNEPLKRDEELSIVHELLHLHFCPVASPDSDSSADVALEQAIHAISRALVGVRKRT